MACRQRVGNPTTTGSLHAPLDLLERVDRLAARKGFSRDELIASALATGLRELERDQDVSEAFDDVD